MCINLNDICIFKPSHRSHSTRLLAATTLRNVLGTKNLAEILSERETISQVMQSSLDEATDPWGVKVGQTRGGLLDHSQGTEACVLPLWSPRTIYYTFSLYCPRRIY